jgi:hypothetical protein
MLARNSPIYRNCGIPLVGSEVFFEEPDAKALVVRWSQSGDGEYRSR